MAIKTVTNANMADYVAERPDRAGLTNAEQVQKAIEENPTLGEVQITTGAETSPDAPPDPGDQKRGAKPPVQARIDELTRLRKEAEELAEDEWNQRRRAEARLAELEAELRAQKPTEAPKVEELKRPRLSDFQTATEFDAAMDEYEAKRAERVRSEVEAATRQQLANERQQAELAKRIEAAKGDFPDWDEVIQKAARTGLKPSEHLQAAMRESEVAAHLAYHFAKNPDDLRRLEQMSPVKAVQAIATIEQKYVKPQEEPARKTPPIETTRAPEPVSSLKGEGGIVKSDLTGLSFQDYKNRRLDELRNRRRR